MGSVGDCFDNAMAESFFATLECELLDRTTLSTHAEARAALFEFIEGWYNTRRRHSALGYRSPLEFERLHQAGAVDGARPVDALPARGERPRCMRRAMHFQHPARDGAGPLLSGVEYGQYAPSSRLVRAVRGIVTTASRCDAGFHHGLLRAPTSPLDPALRTGSTPPTGINVDVHTMT